MQKLTLLDVGPQGIKVYWPWKMYLCENCFSNIPANQPSFKFTIQKRTKQYPKRPKVHVFIDKQGKKQVKDDPGGKGHEIVKEIRVCKSCLDLLMSN